MILSYYSTHTSYLPYLLCLLAYMKWTVHPTHLLRIALFCSTFYSIFLLCPSSISAVVRTYPATPGAEQETRITGFAENTYLSFEKHVTYHPDKPDRLGSIRTRFASSGPVVVQLHFAVPFSRASLRSATQDIPLTISGQDVAFQLPGPGHYLMKVRGISEYILVWVDDANAAQVGPRDAGVVDVTTKGVSPNASQLQTAAIQAAIDSCPAGCTLYFPPGMYRSGALKIQRADFTLYLAAGAVIKASDTVCDIDPGCRGGTFIYINKSRNIQLRGKGVIDASGMASYHRLDNGGEVKVHNVDIEDSQNIFFEDLLFMDSNSWGLHFKKNTDVNVKNVKVFSGKDGIDPDSTSNITIDTVFIQSIDDSVAVKTRFEDVPASNITVRNCIVQSRATALKVGTEVRARLNNILFSDCTIFDSDRTVNLSASEDADKRTTNASQRNIRIYGNIETDEFKPNGTGPGIQPAPSLLAGDLDNDKDVDIFDYNLLLGSFGTVGAAGFSPADIDREGDVDIFDYNKLIENFGKKQ